MLIGWALLASSLLSPSARGQEEARFTTYGGNDWWIEVYVEPFEVITEVDVSVEGRAWRALTLQDWGSWATSFYVEPGSRLRFRAFDDAGQIATSATYVWPSGNVGAPLEEPADESAGGFLARFFGLMGTNWWVESYVDASEPVASVEARANGGPWYPLDETQWGSWASSFFVASGSALELRAFSSAGEEARSALYSWPDGTVLSVPATDEGPGSTGSMFVEFTRPMGNDWWVEIDVYSSEPIVEVEARVNGGMWIQLGRTAWGSWASSFFVPSGSLVEMRAHASDGRTARSPIYLWPAGSIVSMPPDGDPPDDEEEPGSDDGSLFFDDPRIVSLGRVDGRVNGQPACSWTGCGFVIETNAARVEMEVEVDVRGGGSDYLRVQVDDEAPRVLELANGTRSVTLASGLPDGSHTIRLFKRTEPDVGTLRFLELSVEGGRLRQASAPQGPRLLFIGDSITAGYGNVGDGPFCGFSAATEDGYNTYANLTALHFGGEAIITAYSGKGVYRNRGSGDPLTMPLLFDRLDVFDAGSSQAFPPMDAVVVNLGTNDFAAGNPSEGPFVSTYAAFLAELRDRFPDAPLFLATSPMLTDDWPAGLAQRSTLRAYLEGVIAVRADAGDRDVYLVDHERQSAEGGVLGCDYHPHVVTHQRMAEELIDALSTYAGW